MLSNQLKSEIRKTDAQTSIRLAEKIRSFTRNKLAELGLKFTKRK